MSLSQKCQYGLRAIFELAKRYGLGPVSTADIAREQAIPARFLEQILGELKQAGYVESRRGAHGGYVLLAEPGALVVGRVIRFFEGPLAPVKCIAGQGGGACPLQGNCAFMGLWDRAQRAVEDVYDSTTFRDLVEEAPQPALSPSYCI